MINSCLRKLSATRHYKRLYFQLVGNKDAFIAFWNGVNCRGEENTRLRVGMLMPAIATDGRSIRAADLITGWRMERGRGKVGIGQ